jgi:hypothetical protein
MFTLSTAIMKKLGIVKEPELLWLGVFVLDIVLLVNAANIINALKS